MRFEFDTTTDGAKEAAALAAALAVLHGSAVADALDNAIGHMEITGTPLASDGHPFNVADHAARTQPIDTTAADAFAPGPETAVVPTSGRALDAAGTPWDERIHASTKTTNKDGTWTRRRNTPDATFDTVMAELKGIVASGGFKGPAEANAAEAFADPTPSEALAAPDTAGPATEASTAGQTVTTAASPSSPTPPPPPPTSTGAVTFPQLMVKITKAQTAGTIDKATVDGFLATFGLDKISGLASAGADTVQAVNAMVDDHVAG